MSDDTRRILEMLSEGKVTVDEADQLLKAIDSSRPSSGAGADSTDRPAPRFLRITVREPGAGGGPEETKVNVRVPLTLVRSGMKLAGIIPGFAGDKVNQKLREKGIDLAQLSQSTDSAQFAALLKDLGEFTIDVDEGKQQVRINCE
jgi:hypothetical protein